MGEAPGCVQRVPGIPGLVQPWAPELLWEEQLGKLVSRSLQQPLTKAAQVEEKATGQALER